MNQEKQIPSREEHDRLIRRIWKICIVMAIAVFLVSGGIVLGLFLAGHDSKKVVEISTAVFQVLILSYGLGFFVPAFLTSLTKMGLGVDMSRRGLEIGERTAQHLDRLQEEFKNALETFSRELQDSVRRLEKRGIDDVIDRL